MSQAIALTVLGGFLGAGKTTVLNHLLRAPHGLRLMVLVNDFGAVNIDASLIESVSGDGVISMRNGCVCCSMGGELMNVLMTIEKQAARLDGLIIEGSGVSDPRKIAQIGMLGEGFALRSVITVVDASTVLDQRDDPYVGDMVKTQIAGAHLILLNKTDRVDSGQRQQVLDWLRDIAGNVPIFTGSHGGFDWEVLLAPALASLPTGTVPSAKMGNAGLFAAGGTGAASRQIFHSYCFETEHAFDEAALYRLFSGISKTVLRAKGIVLIGPEKTVAVLQYVRGQPLALQSSSQLVSTSAVVFIGTPEFSETELAEPLADALLS